MTVRRCAVTLLLLVMMLAAEAEEKKSSAKWTKVPDGFRGVKFGATKEEAEAVLGRLRCTEMRGVKPRPYVRPVPAPRGAATPAMPPVAPPKPAPPHVVCLTADKERAFTANGKVVGTEYVFDEGRFVAVNLRRLDTMRPSQVVMYADIRPLFETEYGTPTSDASSRVKGSTPKTVSTWDVQQNKTVNRTAPEFFDYESTCAKWTDPSVEIALCARDDLFSTGSIETSGWIAKKRAWFADGIRH